jgi:hypothetical protein
VLSSLLDNIAPTIMLGLALWRLSRCRGVACETRRQESSAILAAFDPPAAAPFIAPVEVPEMTSIRAPRLLQEMVDPK